MKEERLKAQSGNSKRLSQSLVKDWVEVGGDKTLWMTEITNTGLSMVNLGIIL